MLLNLGLLLLFKILPEIMFNYYCILPLISFNRFLMLRLLFKLIILLIDFQLILWKLLI